MQHLASGMGRATTWVRAAGPVGGFNG